MADFDKLAETSWSYQSFTADDLAKTESFPKIVKVLSCKRGPNFYEGYRKDQILYIHSVKKQLRFLADDTEGNEFSIPINSKVILFKAETQGVSNAQQEKVVLEKDMLLPMNIRCKHFQNKDKNIELTLKERGLMKYLVGACISQDGVVSKIECIPIDCQEIRFKVALNRSKQTTLSCFHDAVLKIISDEEFNNYQGNTEIIVNAQFNHVKVQEEKEPQCKQSLEKQQDEGNKGNKNEFQSILPLEITSGLNDKEDIVQNSPIPAQKPPPVPKKPKSVKNNIPVKPPVKPKPKKIDERTVAHQKISTPHMNHHDNDQPQTGEVMTYETTKKKAFTIKEHIGPTMPSEDNLTKFSEKSPKHNDPTPSEHNGHKTSQKSTEHNELTPSEHEGPKPFEISSEHNDLTLSEQNGRKPSEKLPEHNDPTSSEHDGPKPSEKSPEHNELTPSEHDGPKLSQKSPEHNELTPSEHDGPKPSQKPPEHNDQTPSGHNDQTPSGHNDQTPSGHNDPKPSENDGPKLSQKSSEPYDSTSKPSEHNIPKSSKQDVHTGTPEKKYCKPFVKSTEQIDLYAGTPFEQDSQIPSEKPSEQIEPFDPTHSKLKDPTHSELKNLILPEPTDCPLFQYCVEGKVFDNYVTTWPQSEYDVPAKRHIYENENEKGNSDEGSGDEYEDMTQGFWPQPNDDVFLDASEPVPSELPLRNEELTEHPEEKEPSGFISYLTVPENEKKVKPSLGDKVKYLFRRSRHRIRSKADIPDDLSNMTCQDVQDCLKLLKLEKHVEKFRENGIDGRLLMDLDQKMMEELDLTMIDIHKLQMFTETKWLPNV